MIQIQAIVKSMVFITMSSVFGRLDKVQGARHLAESLFFKPQTGALAQTTANNTAWLIAFTEESSSQEIQSIPKYTSSQTTKTEKQLKCLTNR
ncbi:expressed unknown protein [Seminavis robusta]|uniref:Uncharacterized protein n=1 Tax=Seminavis robusta TaxID=568900 RepID=A0A9N8ES26_9STRA|nr:expressed unknown protein [Seminavis robusta]|eukprot:Sro1940_g306660.1 n/a (93) ;mRNA; f:18058-18427